MTVGPHASTASYHRGDRIDAFMRVPVGLLFVCGPSRIRWALIV